MFKKILLAAIAAGLVIGTVSIQPSYADSDEKHEKGEKRGEREQPLPAVVNEAYKQECSSCHFLYLPGLLPARSWQAVMKNSDKHFGENLALDESIKKEIAEYLVANSAEKSRGNEWSRKIVASLNADQAPERITEVPYIKKEHRKVKSETFKSKAVGSFSNCGACHTKGAEGNFEEEFIKIPK